MNCDTRIAGCPRKLRIDYQQGEGTIPNQSTETVEEKTSGDCSWFLFLSIAINVILVLIMLPVVFVKCYSSKRCS
ncbi:Hypothetical predicted protein [Cloeon dipterum]|uniref:Uncharacterized protein n=1 Tax=Cloeon dipterum TaxID=197152 RepID=A0A8S1DBR6_9INSE|nr:Hypothetical predicted protein [Cloeon dipterum]